MSSRRRFLQSMLYAGAAAPLLRVWPAQAAAADAERRPRLLLVILRGGLDGLHAVPPLADPDYVRLRGKYALRTSGENAALALDADFGLHPLLPGLHALYRSGQALMLHAVATPYRERSHFDAQDVLESGHVHPHAAADGWLNRALAQLPAAAGAERGMALGASLPLVLRGATPVGSWSPSLLPAPDTEFLDRVARLYAGDAPLAGAFARARELHGETGAGAEGGGAGALPALMQAAARFLSAPQGPSVAVLDMGGWDSHAGQFNARAPLARSLRQLDGGIVALRAGLDAAWQHTVALICTEFGRTAAPNGSGGTDHGTASAVFVLGGAVSGGRVIARWPGLAPGRLHEGRDLAPTLDLRAVFKAVLQDHWKLTRARLDRDVFPGSASVAPVTDLFA